MRVAAIGPFGNLQARALLLKKENSSQDTFDRYFYLFIYFIFLRGKKEKGGG